MKSSADSRTGFGGQSGDWRLGALEHGVLGIGEVRVRGKVLPADDGLRVAGLEPLKLRAKKVWH